MKDIKLGILDEIKKLMGDRMVSKGAKPKAMAVEITAALPKKEGGEEGEEMEKPELEAGEGLSPESKLSPEEMSQLKSLYEKMMC